MSALAKMEVYLPAVTEVTQKSSYSLFDILVVKKGTLEELESLKKIKLENLSKEEILRVVKNNKESILLVINEENEIKQSKSLSKEEAIRKVTNYLTVQCQECIYEVQISQIPSNARFEFIISESLFRNQKGSFLIPLKSDTSTTLGWFSGTWKAFKKVIVLNKWVSQNSRLVSQDMKEELKEVTYITDRLANKDELMGRQVKKNLNENTILTRELLIVEKDIKKGDVVKLIVGEGPIEVQLMGSAENDGQIGDYIKVKTPLKNLSGKIIDKGQVKIE